MPSVPVFCREGDGGASMLWSLLEVPEMPFPPTVSSKLEIYTMRVHFGLSLAL